MVMGLPADEDGQPESAALIRVGKRHVWAAVTFTAITWCAVAVPEAWDAARYGLWAVAALVTVDLAWMLLRWTWRNVDRHLQEYVRRAAEKGREPGTDKQASGVARRRIPDDGTSGAQHGQ